MFRSCMWEPAPLGQERPVPPALPCWIAYFTAISHVHIQTSWWPTFRTKTKKEKKVLTFCYSNWLWEAQHLNVWGLSQLLGICELNLRFAEKSLSFFHWSKASRWNDCPKNKSKVDGTSFRQTWLCLRAGSYCHTYLFRFINGNLEYRKVVYESRGLLY